MTDRPRSRTPEWVPPLIDGRKHLQEKKPTMKKETRLRLTQAVADLVAIDDERDRLDKREQELMAEVRELKGTASR